MRHHTLVIILLILLPLLFPLGKALPNVLDSYPYEAANTLGMGSDSDNKFAQSWKNTVPSVAITSATFYLSKQGTPTGNIHAALYRGSTSDFATANPMEPAETSSQPLDISRLTATVTGYQFNFSGQTVLNEGLYFIGLRMDEAIVSSGNTAIMSFDLTAPTHPGHMFVKLAGTWTEYTDRDVHFVVSGELGGGGGSGVAGDNQPSIDPGTLPTGPLAGGIGALVILAGFIAFAFSRRRGR